MVAGHWQGPKSAQLQGQAACLESQGLGSAQQAIATLVRLWNSVGPVLVSQPHSQAAWQMESQAYRCFQSSGKQFAWIGHWISIKPMRGCLMIHLLPRDHSEFLYQKGLGAISGQIGDTMAVFMTAGNNFRNNAKLMEIMRSQMHPHISHKALANFSTWRFPHSLLSSPGLQHPSGQDSLVFCGESKAPMNSSVTPRLSRVEACQNPMVHLTVSNQLGEEACVRGPEHNLSHQSPTASQDRLFFTFPSRGRKKPQTLPAQKKICFILVTSNYAALI